MTLIPVLQFSLAHFQSLFFSNVSAIQNIFNLHLILFVNILKVSSSYSPITIYIFPFLYPVIVCGYNGPNIPLGISFI